MIGFMVKIKIYFIAVISLEDNIHPMSGFDSKSYISEILNQAADGIILVT